MGWELLAVRIFRRERWDGELTELVDLFVRAESAETTNDNTQCNEQIDIDLTIGREQVDVALADRWILASPRSRFGKSEPMQMREKNV